MSGGVTEGVLESIHDLRAVIDREAFVRDGRAGDVATQALEGVPVTGSAARAGMEGESRELSDGRRTDPYTFFPFGGGVRHCLGAAFATYEAKIVLARVLSRMTLRPDPDHAIRVVRRGLALGPSSGLPVIGTTD